MTVFAVVVGVPLAVCSGYLFATVVDDVFRGGL